MQYILTTIGSYGDLFPILGLAVELQQRGHEVHLLAAETYRELIEQKHIQFHPIISADSQQRVSSDPRFWTNVKGLKLFMDHLVLPSMAKTYDTIQQLHSPGKTVVVSHLMNFGARIARDKLAIKLVSVHLAPIGLRSAQYPSRYSHITLDWMPRFATELTPLIQDAVLYQLLRLKKINRYRKRLGLARVFRPMYQWIHSPDLVLGLFPSWFGPQVTDWPCQIKLSSFPLYDPFDDANHSQSQYRIDSGAENTLLFTFGSWNNAARKLFHESVRVCEQLQCHGIFLSRNKDQIPKQLPTFIKHHEYLPLEYVLPQVSAIVHHGGIGTIAEAIRAGTPQIVVPLAHDQLDNAYRLAHRKLGAVISRKQYQDPLAARTIQSALNDSAIKQACQTYASQLDSSKAIQMSCDFLEQSSINADMPAAASSAKLAPVCETVES